MQIKNLVSAGSKHLCRGVMVGAMLSGAISTLSAAPLNITNIDGSWVNANPALNITATSNVASPGTDSVRWGGTVGDINTGSGYDFTPATDLIPVTLNSNFALGTFTHGQRTLSAFDAKDLHQEVIIPAATSSFHGDAFFARMLLQQ